MQLLPTTQGVSIADTDSRVFERNKEEVYCQDFQGMRKDEGGSPTSKGRKGKGGWWLVKRVCGWE